MILEGWEEECLNTTLATIQFRMFHILIFKSYIVPLCCVSVKFGFLHQEKNTD